MASALDVSSSRDARPLEGAWISSTESDEGYSRLSQVGGRDKGHSESVLPVHRSSDLGMAGALDVSSSRDAHPLEVKDDAYSGLLARVRGVKTGAPVRR
eukprot:6208328-Pleurochrysis_carterae.AAC.3